MADNKIKRLEDLVADFSPVSSNIKNIFLKLADKIEQRIGNIEYKSNDYYISISSKKHTFIYIHVCDFIEVNIDKRFADCINNKQYFIDNTGIVRRIPRSYSLEIFHIEDLDSLEGVFENIKKQIDIPWPRENKEGNDINEW